VEHRDPVREVVHHGEVMADEQRSEAKVLLELVEQVEHGGLHRDVEGTRRLVRDQEARAQREGPGERGPLALAARELVREPVPVRPRQADRLEQFVHALARLPGVRGDAVDHEGFGHGVRDAQQRVEAGGRVLEHEADVLPHRAELTLAEGVHLVAEHLE